MALIIAFFLAFSSCARNEKSCEELLTVALEYGIENYGENGYFFFKSASAGESFFLSETKREKIYGARFVEALNGTADYAIYFAASAPYEIAIFKCHSRNDLDEIVKMCYERLDTKRVGLRFGRWESASREILVSVKGRYVFFIFTDCAERSYGVEEALIAALNN